MMFSTFSTAVRAALMATATAACGVACAADEAAQDAAPGLSQVAPQVAPQEPPQTTPPASERWAVHGQFTNVTQHHAHFRSPYSGTNSLAADGRTEETTDITVYAGLRLAAHTEAWIDAEIDQGFGLSNTVGMGGFPSGEAYKIGANTPYPRLPRAFVRHLVPLGDGSSAVDGTANQLGGSRPDENLTLTAGKFSVTDVFDANRYAHDPRGDFLNWSIIDSGAFDYAADAWGYTYGVAAEWTRDAALTVRAGVFQLSKVPNGKITGVDFGQFMAVAEIEHRHHWLAGLDGKIALLGFVNRGRMARYDDAVAAAAGSGRPPEVAPVRREGSRPGVALNVEQQLASDLGAFVRASIDRGNVEAYEFTEINRSVAAGLSLAGTRWGRPGDTVGVAGVVNGLSDAARRYFQGGGIGILIGDGGLTYGAEQIVETYYALQIVPHATVSLDYQHALHPAYNRDRGPVSIYGARVHLDF